MTNTWRGIFTIPQTPFDAKGRLDEDSLRREVDFCVRAGAHGLVTPVVASEFYVLSDAERECVVQIVIKEAQGRLPVIIGVTAASQELAADFARQASESGADGVIALPPHVLKASRDGVYAYYRALSEASHLPIVIQNAPPPLGSALAPAFRVQLCQELEHVDYIKEETLPTGHYISAILDQREPAVKGVFGGAAARWMLPELERGACGFMPACQFTDIYVQIWELWEAGEAEAARALFNKLLPLINLESVLSVALAKELLVRRGVIANAFVRRPDGARPDSHDRREVDRCLADIEPYYRLRS
jgi:dihydrodipicolinate synthase/N-acetylneuraminate lyase